MFKDRADAGRKLASELKRLNPEATVILCIPRGGVVVGAEVAKEMEAALDLIVPRKIGAPFNTELAIGAVAQDGSTYLNHRLISMLGISKEELNGLIKKEMKEIERRMITYRGSTDYPDYQDKTLILVDDGAATGYTMLAAAEFAKKSLKPGKLIIAVPVAPKDTLELFAKVADETVCMYAPGDFYAVGQFYYDFSQISDKTVLSILTRFQKNSFA